MKKTYKIGRLYWVRTELMDGNNVMQKILMPAVLEKIGEFTFKDGSKKDGYTFRLLPMNEQYTTSELSEISVDYPLVPTHTKIDHPISNPLIILPNENI